MTIAVDDARRLTVRAHAAARQALHRTARDVDASPGDASLGELERRLLASLQELSADYLDLLPRVAITRCPISGAAVTVAVDTADLDGPWWDYQAPLRPAERVQPTLYAFTGALALSGAPAAAEFLVKPGPAVPYVLPRLLGRPSVRGVLSSVAIGPHRGYVIAYFSTEYLRGEQRANAWGANEYRVHDEAGEPVGWDAVPESEDEMDFELAPWIERGRLQWIAPGDSSLTLRAESAGCPYLGLGGRRDLQRVEEGKVR